MCTHKTEISPYTHNKYLARRARLDVGETDIELGEMRQQVSQSARAVLDREDQRCADGLVEGDERLQSDQ